MERLAVRRVVTGHAADGRAIVTEAGTPPETFELGTLPGTFFFEIWKCGAVPAVVDNGADPTLGPRKMSPAAGGVAVRVVQIPVEVAGAAMTAEEIAEHFREAGSPEAATAQGGHALMHRTESVDFGILIDGELTLVLDDSEVVLHPGDVVVQRGTNHAWSNRGTKPCRIAFVLVDGTYSPEVRESLERGKGGVV